MAEGDLKGGPRGTVRMNGPTTADEPTPRDPLPAHFKHELLEARAKAELEARAAAAVIAPLVERGRAAPEPDAPRVVLAPDVSRALQPRQLVGKYRVGLHIGSGGFADVFEGTHIQTGAACVLKVLNPVEAARTASVERFKAECTTLEGLRNVEGVVNVIEHFRSPEAGVVLVMQRLMGGTLRQALHARRLSPLEKLWICIRLARAIGLLHLGKVIHRDLKPENIFLEISPGQDEANPDRFRPVILDLGCAKTPDGPTTSSSSINLTWQYASPEQLGRFPLSSRADIYAFGCILYEMFEGEKPFDYMEKDEDPENPAPTAHKISYHILYSPKMPDNIGVRLWNEIIGICLEKNPDDRFQSMAEVEAALRSFASDLTARRLHRDDHLPAALAGARARPAPSPLPALPSAGRTLDTPPREVPLDARLMSPSVVVLEGPPDAVTKRFAIGRSLTIGRWIPGSEPKRGIADLTFAIDTLSTRHCKLEAALEDVAKSVYLVRDLQSTNGTQLCGNPIVEGLLRPGGTLRIGGEVLLQLYGPGTLADADALADTLDVPVRAGRPRTRPRDLTPMQFAEAKPSVRSVDVKAQIEQAVKAERARSTRWLALIGAVLAVVILAIVLQVFHVLPPWLGGGR